MLANFEIISIELLYTLEVLGLRDLTNFVQAYTIRMSVGNVIAYV